MILLVFVRYSTMQSVPEHLLQMGVSYRVHRNVSPDGSFDFLGSLYRKNVFDDGDIRYLLDHLLVPVTTACWRENPKGSHVREVSTWLRSINPETHTFYVTAQNMWVQRIIAAKTGRLVQSPLIAQYF
jgi:hypothetical protein